MSTVKNSSINHVFFFFEVLPSNFRPKLCEKRKLQDLSQHKNFENKVVDVMENKIPVALTLFTTLSISQNFDSTLEMETKQK